MKIAGTGSSRSNATRRKGGTDAAAGDFAGHMSGPARVSAPAVSGTTQVASVGALVALQASTSFSADPGAAEIDRAEDLLDQLDRIRLGMLTGGVSPVPPCRTSSTALPSVARTGWNPGLRL